MTVAAKASYKVPMDAVLLARIVTRKALASEQVFALRNRLKVRRIRAGSVAAQMVDLKSLGNWAIVNLVRNAMHILRLAKAAEMPVPVGHNRATPEPAIIRVVLRDFAPKSSRYLVANHNGLIPRACHLFPLATRVFL